MNFDFSQSIGIYGFGVEGKSLFHWLKKHGAKNIRVIDDKTPDIAVQLHHCDIIFRSPGVHPQKIIAHIGEKNIQKVSSATDLFFDLSPTQNTIGVTGTKGKGTTSSLITNILSENFSGKKQVFLGGNIGTPVFDFFDEITEEDIVVLEMSSFQLYDITHSPHISVLLRTDTEHLDWHSNVFDYRNAKKNIFLHQKKGDTFIYLGKSEIVKDMQKSLDSSRESEETQKISVFSQDEKLWIDLDKNTEKIIGTVFGEKNTEKNKDDEENIHTSEIKLRGSFQQENVLPAIAVAKQFNIPNSVIRKVLQNFSGLPMRCELVGEKNGIQFFNDSFSTIPETSISALSTFPGSSPLFLILGGSEKNSNFSVLAQACADKKNLKKIYTIGKTAARIQEELEKRGYTSVQKCNSLEDIFIHFKSEAKKGDTLLLSPGCASFGMFKNYKERGRIFNDLVQHF
jgi:UDP-N-acetylmuramoylalanine--D-glutamate ligase